MPSLRSVIDNTESEEENSIDLENEHKENSIYVNDGTLSSPNIKKPPEYERKKDFHREISNDFKEGIEGLGAAKGDLHSPEQQQNIGGATENKFTFRNISRRNTNNTSYREVLEEPSVNPAADTHSLNFTSKPSFKNLFHPDMERFKEFSIYFPHNNMSTVISYLLTKNKGLKGKTSRKSKPMITSTNRLSLARALTQQKNQMKFFNKNKPLKPLDSPSRKAKKLIF